MKGLTLIEFIIYITVLVLILLIVANFSWNIIYSDIKATSYREVQQNARFAMEKISQSIRDGQDPLIVFSLSNGLLYQNGIALTSDQVRVTNLAFTSLDNTYKINLSIEYYNPENRIEYQALVDMENTIVARQ
jgi:hypothetical protein